MTRMKAKIISLSTIMLLACLPLVFLPSIQTSSEKDNEKDELSERDVAVLCGASEDYEENKEQCDKLYDMLEEGIIEDDRDFEYD